MECFYDFCGNGEEESVGLSDGNLLVVKIPTNDFSEPDNTTEIVVEGDVSPCEFYLEPRSPPGLEPRSPPGLEPRSPPGLEPEFDSIRLTCNEFPRRSSKFTEFMETVPAESVRNSF